MSSPCHTKVVVAAIVLAAGAGACQKAGSPAVRAPAHAPAMNGQPEPVRVSGLFPGDKPDLPPDPRAAIYEGDPNHIAAGKRYFTWYNCNGCHFNGGGGIGPAFMDDKWSYGDRLEQIYSSISEGRPNGMPTWRGKIPEAQIWELAAYVKSLSSPEYLQRNGQPKTPLDPATLDGEHLAPRLAG